MDEPSADEFLNDNEEDLGADMDSDVDMDSLNDGENPPRGGALGEGGRRNRRMRQRDLNMNKLYTSRNRVPPIMMSLLYDPLMGMLPNIQRTEWEQKIGGLPAFHVYCMSRAIYSSSSNPLLKPEHFMPEATDMSATERWKEYMGEGDNPLINFYVAGKLFCLSSCW